MGPKAFLEMLGVSGLRFCARTHFKKVLYRCRDLFTNVNTSDYSLALEKQHPVMIGSDEAPFNDLDLSFLLKKRDKLKLTIISEHFCQKQRYKNGINYLR